MFQSRPTVRTAFFLRVRTCTIFRQLISKASPASSDGSVHENGRRCSAANRASPASISCRPACRHSYAGEIPPELSERLNKILCPKNQEVCIRPHPRIRPHPSHPSPSLASVPTPRNLLLLHSISTSLQSHLCVQLAQLLLDKRLMLRVSEFPWLATALKRDVC